MTFVGSRRNVVATHYRDEEFRRCLVCLGMVELDHAEALQMNVPREGVDFEVVCVIDREGVVDNDFVEGG